MAVRRALRVAILLSLVSSTAQQKRGFIGIASTEGGDTAKVDQETEKMLKSGLTTVFLPILYIIVVVVALPTNAMAVWVFLFRTKKKHPAAIYMANIALCDLLFVVWIPLKIAYHFRGNNWTFGEGLCKVLVAFFYGNMYCSILFITCLSVQRYWVIAHPLSEQRRNNRVAIIVSLSIWVFIWLSTTPLYLYSQTAKISNLDITTCHDVSIIHNTTYPLQDVKYAFGYFIFMAVFAFLVPSVVIIVAYACLLRTLGNSTDDQSVGKKRRKSVILIITVLVTFLLCFVPSNIMLVVHYSLLATGVSNNGYGFYITTLCLASLNSCLDPFIYYYISEDFRENVKNTLLCRSSRTVDRMKVSFSSLKYSKKTNTYTSESSQTQTSSC